MKTFGLIGRNLSHSFSSKYFNQKFKDLNLSDCLYKNFEITSIEDFKNLILTNNNVRGLNVTIPYKESILPYLDELDASAKEIGAVNTIKVTRTQQGLQTTGYNTDIIGFEQSIQDHIEHLCSSPVLILGDGGAAAAVKFVFEKLGCTINQVSRKPNEQLISYSALNHDLITANKTIVNCTPVGMFPEVDSSPLIPYESIDQSHLLIDLIYNPSKTKFLQLGEEKGAKTINGEVMLYAQAEASWEIWNNP